MPDVKAKLKPLRPKQRRKLSVRVKAQPHSKRYMLVGTAFDYLLRFELQRRAPHAVSKPWIAQSAPGMIRRTTTSGTAVISFLTKGAPEQHIPLEEVAERASDVLADAEAAVAAYSKLKAPTAGKQGELAAHAIRLAKLDTAYRARQLEPDFEEANSEDVRDLVDMLAIVPFDDLLDDNILLLNPTFGQTSWMVDGADADLIAGDLLVDFKTTKKGEIEVRNLDQILGYFLLARRQGSFDVDYPAIKRLGLYYCRHGYLWSLDSSVWTSHPEFLEVERWFFQRAREEFGASN